VLRGTILLAAGNDEGPEARRAKSVIDCLRPSAPPDRPKPEMDKPKEVEPELETV